MRKWVLARGKKSNLGVQGSGADATVISSFWVCGAKRRVPRASSKVRGEGGVRLGRQLYPVGSSAVVIELFVQFVFGDLVGRDASRGTWTLAAQAIVFITSVR